MAQNWSLLEVEAIVSDYLDMLTLEIGGTAYNKSAHRQRLKPLLQDRSDPSIERKHQNISAVLLEMGLPFIEGYKPLRNYQRSLLPELVAKAVVARPLFLKTIEADVDREARVPSVDDILGTMVPKPPISVRHPAAPQLPKRLLPEINYLEREFRNRSLGAAGEQFVVNYERARLALADQERLGEDVEWVSRTRGDGLGYDVLSFEENGQERFIEVKTTRYGKQTPFFISPNELRFCERHLKAFQLYRVFAFQSDPKMFALQGAIESHCRLNPSEYRATLL